jgi:hypothetical protein
VQERFVEERENLVEAFVGEGRSEALLSLILQLVRVPCSDLQSGKVCDSLSAVFFFGVPPFLFVSFTCSFSFETIRFALCDLHFSHGLWLCGTSGWWWWWWW